MSQQNEPDLSGEQVLESTLTMRKRSSHLRSHKECLGRTAQPSETDVLFHDVLNKCAV